MFFKSGQLVDQVMGAASKVDLKRRFDADRGVGRSIGALHPVLSRAPEGGAG